MRTCSAGSLVSSSEPPVGFHLHNTPYNLARVKGLTNEIFSMFNKIPEGGLLVGRKSLDPANCTKKSTARNRLVSIPFFQKLKNLFLETVKNISIFEQHKKIQSQTHYFYSWPEDTHYLCLEEKLSDNKFKYVSSLNELLSFFYNIFISKNDKLYINGKEILETDAPHIFEKTIKSKTLFN